MPVPQLSDLLTPATLRGLADHLTKPGRAGQQQLAALLATALPAALADRAPIGAAMTQLSSAARSPKCCLGAGTRVWHQAQVADDVEIGSGCTLGKSCYVGSGARIGDNVKIGNHADLFGAEVEDCVMISPQAVLTEDRTPRATLPDGRRQGPSDWTSTPVIVRRGATIGAGARIAPGVEIGPYALIGIGAVVL